MPFAAHICGPSEDGHMPHPTPFLAPISEEIWDLKYRLKRLDGVPLDAGIDDTFRRVASAAAAPAYAQS